MRPNELLDVLHDTPRRVEAAVRGLPRAQLVWTPAPGHWSILEVLRHVRDMERAVALAVTRSDAAGLIVVGGAAAQMERDAPPSELLREWKRLRRDALERLRLAQPDLWGTEVVLPRVGAMSLERLATWQAEHDLQHLKQIESILERHAILSRLAATPREVRALADGLPRDVLRRVAGPEAMSLIDEMAALCHFESQMLVRYARIVEIDRPPLPPLDAEPVPLRWQDPGADPLAAWREFERLRGLTQEILHALGPRVWQRKGVHPQRGELSIAELVTQHLDRDSSSLGRLRSLRSVVMSIAPVSSTSAPVVRG